MNNPLAAMPGVMETAHASYLVVADMLPGQVCPKMITNNQAAEIVFSLVFASFLRPGLKQKKPARGRFRISLPAAPPFTVRATMMSSRSQLPLELV